MPCGFAVFTEHTVTTETAGSNNDKKTWGNRHYARESSCSSPSLLQLQLLLPLPYPQLPCRFRVFRVRSCD